MKKSLLILLLFILFSHQYLQAQCPASPAILQSQQDIDDFVNNCNNSSTYVGNIDIDAGANPIDLSGMSFLEQVTGNLRITENSALQNLNGLQNLHTVTGFLLIRGNDQLTDMQGLEGLQTVSGNFTIQSNDNLTSLNGLDQLMSVSTIFRVWFNPLLTTCATVGVCHLIDTQSPFNFAAQTLTLDHQLDTVIPLSEFVKIYVDKTATLILQTE